MLLLVDRLKTSAFSLWDIHTIAAACAILPKLVFQGVRFHLLPIAGIVSNLAHFEFLFRPVKRAYSMRADKHIGCIDAFAALPAVHRSAMLLFHILMFGEMFRPPAGKALTGGCRLRANGHKDIFMKISLLTSSFWSSFSG